MNESIVKSVNIRVTEKQKKTLDKMAKEQNETLKDIILNGTIYNKEKKLQEQISNYKNELDELNKMKKNIKQFEQSIKQLKELLKTKEKFISTLIKQLDQTNKRVDDYSRQLEQQQSLQLATVSTNKELHLKLETLEEEQISENKKGFFYNLFNR